MIKDRRRNVTSRMIVWLILSRLRSGCYCIYSAFRSKAKVLLPPYNAARTSNEGVLTCLVLVRGRGNSLGSCAVSAPNAASVAGSNVR